MTTYNQLLTALLEYAPNATVGQDNDGQIVIYTNLTETSDNILTEMGD